MKVSIIGGGGLVGSMAAYALQCGGVVSTYASSTPTRTWPRARRLDLLTAPAWSTRPAHRGRRHERMATSNIVVITAGLRRKPDESRLDLINRNVDLFLALLDQVKAAGLKENAYLVVVSNPVDVLTYLAVQRSGLPWQRVLGLGTQLDTARFRGYLARRLQAPATQVQAMILGEHGDSMVPIWSSATVAGLPLEQWPGFTPALCSTRFSRRRRRPARLLIKLKGGSGFGVGLSIREVVQASSRDSRRVLPVSTFSKDYTASATCAYRFRRWWAAAACGRQIELPLTPKERAGHPTIGARAARDHRSSGKRASARCGRRRNGTPGQRRAATPFRERPGRTSE